MQQPGGYTDPSGQPGFRFWDGQAWTTATTSNPNTPWPTRAPGQPGASGHPGSPGGPGQSGAPKRKTGIIVGAVAAVVALALAGGGTWWFMNRSGDPDPGATPAPTMRPVTTAPATTAPGQPTTAPTMPPGNEAALNCSGGNNSAQRRWQPETSSTGVVYDTPPGWSFAFDNKYWTWMDDFTSLGKTRVDGSSNEAAGITLGGVRFENGFADQATAGELTVQCLEGALSTDGPARAGAPATSEITLGGMKTIHTKVEVISDGDPRPLVVDIYTIDSGQGSKWAQLITFQPANSEVQPTIDEAVKSLRHL